MRRALLAFAALTLASSIASAHDLPPTPITQSPMGPLIDVTGAWTDYQPAVAFCVKPDVYQLTGIGPTVTGADPDCAFSGFAPGDSGLVKIEVQTPPLCNGCRRLFMDYTKIPANEPGVRYAHGHAYFHYGSFNPTYTVEPIAHSPNVKNFSNDKLVVPEGSPQEPLVWAFDLHNRTYTGNTTHVVHSEVQGPYYTGPWYMNDQGERITGAYLDINVANDLGSLALDHRLNEIAYFAAFHSGETTCPDELSDTYADGDAFYGGCIDAIGIGREVIDPFA
ncbi:MAG: hypothetical protein ACRDKG_00670 [Actinomycetota bacterium]